MFSNKNNQQSKCIRKNPNQGWIEAQTLIMMRQRWQQESIDISVGQK